MKITKIGDESKYVVFSTNSAFTESSFDGSLFFKNSSLSYLSGSAGNAGYGFDANDLLAVSFTRESNAGLQDQQGPPAVQVHLVLQDQQVVQVHLVVQVL